MFSYFFFNSYFFQASQFFPTMQFCVDSYFIFALFQRIPNLWHFNIFIFLFLFFDSPYFFPTKISEQWNWWILLRTNLPGKCVARSDAMFCVLKVCLIRKAILKDVRFRDIRFSNAFVSFKLRETERVEALLRMNLFYQSIMTVKGNLQTSLNVATYWKGNHFFAI